MLKRHLVDVVIFDVWEIFANRVPEKLILILLLRLIRGHKHVVCCELRQHFLGNQLGRRVGIYDFLHGWRRCQLERIADDLTAASPVVSVHVKLLRAQLVNSDRLPVFYRRVDFFAGTRCFFIELFDPRLCLRLLVQQFAKSPYVGADVIVLRAVWDQHSRRDLGIASRSDRLDPDGQKLAQIQIGDDALRFCRNLDFFRLAFYPFSTSRYLTSSFFPCPQGNVLASRQTAYYY
ncbi:hypothetical protein P4V06_04100 [Brevibacillus parabrevis]|nr:hypothetical protein [Brevibacillus parabrevis]